MDESPTEIVRPRHDHESASLYSSNFGDVSQASKVDSPPVVRAEETTPSAPDRRDEEIWTLANRIEQLHRSGRALHDLVGRMRQAEAPVITVGPRIGGSANIAPPLPLPAQEVADPWWRCSALPDIALVPAPGFACFSLRTVTCEAVAVTVLGLRGKDLEFAVAKIEDEQRKTLAFKPVFLTDSPDFGPMTRRGYSVEFLAPYQLAGDGGPEGFSRELRRFIARKWGIAGFVDMRSFRVPPKPPAPAPVPVPRPARLVAPLASKRRKAAVVAWDLGHNPAGRAIVLYDLLAQDWEVELVGPLWSRFGGKLWEPIADSHRRVHALPCETLEEFWPAALAFASAAKYDLVVVCKPRLPSILIGALLKTTCGCPLVLDIDDFELSFFQNETAAALDELDAAGANALREPYAELATRAADGVVRDADAILVSNVALRNRFGGTLVRHARDEELFRPDRFDRRAERLRMGISDQDFALVFVGTVRAHKGVFEVARTLAALPDKRFVLHVVGDIPDRRVQAELGRHDGARIALHGNCAFQDLPSRIAAADAVVLLQDVEHPVSQYQIPAKVSDASAFGLPVLATDVPPLRDLALQGIVTTIAAADLGPSLVALMAEREAGGAALARMQIREAFEAELGFRVNRARLEQAIARAAAVGPGLPPRLGRLIEIANRAYVTLRKASAAAAPAEALPCKAPAAARRPFDIVMFWKQNDTGLYGRRSDMMMKYLLASGRVGRVLQIDAPLEVGDLARSLGAGSGSAGALILGHTIDNQFALRDSDRHRLRTFIWDRRGRSPVLPGVARSLAEYPAYIEAQMAQAGIRPADAIAWVCPVVFDFPAVAKHIPFRAIVGDLIDDQRTFDMVPAYRNRICASYAETLPLFDLTFTNCMPVAEAFADLAPAIRVIPNGTELHPSDPGPAPKSLADLPRPIAGYVGNLRDRLDWPLLREAALSLPHVSFAIVGGGARDADLRHLEGLPNVALVGVVPYGQVRACIGALDVALVPHVRSVQTTRMNPLKIYNYFAAGRPIVSTEVENVEDALRPFIRFVAEPAGFVAAIADALAAPPHHGPRFQRALAGITWDSRVQAVLDAMDAWMANRR